MNSTELLRAIIVDDEKKGISTLKQLVGKFTPDVKIIAECLNPQDAIALIEDHRPEIVFLDIDMPEMNGFEMLEKLNWKEFNLVFTTAHQEYGLKALKNNAIDYLLKPISYKDLSSTISNLKHKLLENTVTIKFNYKELLHSLHSPQKPRLLIHSITELEYIDPDEIICMESQSNYTRITLNGFTEVSTRKTLKEFENQLCSSGSNFMRVHNSFIINLNRTLRYLKVSDEIILANNIKVPLSKSRRDLFFKWMNI